MKYLKTYKIFEVNKRLENRAHLDECWYSAKIGDTVPMDYIYNYVEYLHDDYDSAFIDGDLGDRIEEYERYILCELPTSELDLEEFQLDDDKMIEYKEMIEKSGDYPPIVVCNQEGTDLLRVIDGTHRGVAVAQMSDTVKAWVGI
jgi:hypothetical protein